MKRDNISRPPDVEGNLRQFNQLLMSYVDFQQAASIAGYVLSEKLHDRRPQGRFILQGLNCGTIVAYCRPFSGTDPGSSIKIPDLAAGVITYSTPMAE